MDAMKHQGKSLGQNVPKMATSDVIGEADNRTGRQVRRYIRLTELIDTLLQKVDEGAIPVTVGTELSYLNVKWQSEVNDILESELCPISVSQASKIKTHYSNNTLSKGTLRDLLREQNDLEKGLQIDCERLRGYFPQEYTIKQCEEWLWKILDEWKYKKDD